MNILITGATGLIGRRLVDALLSQSHQLTILTRSPHRATQYVGRQVTVWETLADQTSLDGFDAVINLAGEPIADKRWTPEQKKKLCDSRWQLTEKLASLITTSLKPPAVFISGSAVGYYGDQGEEVVDEEHSAKHHEFSWQLCAQWEALARAATSEATRVCLLRTGVVLSPTGGALTKMVLPFRVGLGGPLGNGQQFMPWIHIEDMVRGIVFLLNHHDAEGAFNMVAPNPVRNAQFSRQLGEVLHRPTLFRVPASVIRLLMGESATLVLGGQQAVPKRLHEAGFVFHYQEVKPALQDVLNK
ncbi:TIGR01777 family protein [Rosenbergiella australiborealis]|uniref:TIGR01777 family protein n=1 Tax=Rosenbergiella australiborealis TaxID=1544696 RepID=A0ABS5T3B1_9GAMM|nr:TIGR01777 family oxidoreductase [Rosenbergiella australiborealis]MBT0726847.1 TIGR01777 family protein [Rosenbergiella australiborealis]